MDRALPRPPGLRRGRGGQAIGEILAPAVDVALSPMPIVAVIPRLFRVLIVIFSPIASAPRGSPQRSRRLV
jgi:hypothetical protein